MKVLILQTDDRLGQASLIDHYSRLGHDVYLMHNNSFNLDWKRIALWPGLLCSNGAGARNLHTNLINDDEFINCFGEDYFLTQDKFDNSIENLPTCKYINEANIGDISIDVYHTLRGAENALMHYKKLSDRYFKNAVWISSTLSAWDHNPQALKANKYAKILPANYETTVRGMNIFCTDVEWKLLGITKSVDLYDRQPVVASFNHNYHVRQQQDFALFTAMNDKLHSLGKEKVINYGGNIRAMGADIRYSHDGPTGNYATLSPKENLEKIQTLSAIVHFKGTDWGGGVFFHALHSSTPIITTSRYIQNSNSYEYLIDGYNCIVVNDVDEATKAVVKITSDIDLRNKLIDGMIQMKLKIFNDEYWSMWKKFIEG